MLETRIDIRSAGQAPLPEAGARRRVTELLRERYPRLARSLLRPLVEVLALARAICAGDAEASEILLLIALRTAEHPGFGEFSHAQIACGAAAAYPSLTTNIRSIAASTGIPRETVRRKVAELVARGWVGRRGNALFLAPAASPALTPLREALLRLAADNHDLVAGVLREPSPPV